MKKRIIFALVFLIAFACFSSCSHMTVGMGMSFGAGPYGVGMTPSFNVGFGGGHYW